jgi:outer membrane protein OmpA-like peptidoglycan-associated protein
MKLRLALAAATCLSLPLVAHAQPISGPYVGLEAGTAFENAVSATGSFPAGAPALNTEIRSDAQIAGFPGAEFGGKFHYNESYAGIGSIGYGFGDGLRVQVDIDYIHNTPTKAEDGFGGAKLGKYDNKFGPMVNVLYDIPVNFPVIPYVGGGIGYQFYNSDYQADIDGLGPDGGPGNINASVTQGSFAYDAIVGLSFPIDAVLPGLALTAEYRFMQITGNEKNGLSVVGGYPTGSAVPGTLKTGQESLNIVTVGMRYALFPAVMMAPAPTPAPMASPAPAAAKTYLVFFDWDKYSLTPRATQIIAEAASGSKTSSVTTIDVSGYTDTSGTPDYNQGLSERRAKTVAAKLVEDGVAASEISIHAYGETHLLVPTGPGVREPQNRRVEIVLN